MNTLTLAAAALFACLAARAAPAPSASTSSALPDALDWMATAPILCPAPANGDSWHSVKDPTIVRHAGNWHLFCTVRGTNRSHAILYLSFPDWDQANRAPRHILPCHPGFFCAPQVFHFTPHQRWYLICQAAADSWSPSYQPAFSTTTELADPNSWSPLQPMFEGQPVTPKAWLDFWVICDRTKAHLFYTSLDGKMWRCETGLDQFPFGWSQPLLALEGDIFEASHTYRLRGLDGYLTLVEAQNGNGWRYYKSYLADRLEGPWRPWLAEREQAFASLRNVQQPAPRWTDAISHGELLRVGTNESLEVDPHHFQFLFQGVLDTDRAGKPYGQIPWQIGLLVPHGTVPDPTR